MRNTPATAAIAPAPAERGFSLIELVLVIVLLGIIATVGAQLMGSGFQLYFTGRDSLSVDAQARLALERLTRELRAVRVSSGLTLAPANEANFIGGDGTAVRYCLGTVSGCPGAAKAPTSTIRWVTTPANGARRVA